MVRVNVAEVGGFYGAGELVEDKVKEEGGDGIRDASILDTEEQRVLKLGEGRGNGADRLSCRGGSGGRSCR